MQNKHVVIIGAGFVGLNCAKGLADVAGVRVTIVDRENHHLFQPLLYQVAMAGLSAADIAAPIRGILSGSRNITVLQTAVTRVDAQAKCVHTDNGEIDFDYLVVAAGAKHSYFGKPEWEPFAPGLKNLAQAAEIRRRVLLAFEEAEKTSDPVRQKQLLTFVIIGGGPTGVELAGAIGEMSRFTLTRDFRHIDPRLARIIIVEGAGRILAPFSEEHAAYATRALEKIGVQVWTGSIVTGIDRDGVDIGAERLQAATVLWAAGVQASSLSAKSGWQTDRIGRVMVAPDLSLPEYPFIFAAGDMAHCQSESGEPLPGLAPVAMQQGRYLGLLLKAEISANGPVAGRTPFLYKDKGQMATIGRSLAILQMGKLHLTGVLAWLGWIVVHIFYLTGFRNRFFVLLSWGWSYLNFKRGARLIVGRKWRFWQGDRRT